MNLRCDLKELVRGIDKCTFMLEARSNPGKRYLVTSDVRGICELPAGDVSILKACGRIPLNMLFSGEMYPDNDQSIYNKAQDY